MPAILSIGKIRCSHEQPECAKCTRLGQLCLYPEPPDRRLIAARRVRARSRPTHEQSGSRDTAFNQPEKLDVGVAAVSPGSLGMHGMYDSLSELSNEAQKLLQDTYFMCAFNSSLTFHRKSLEQAFREGVVPNYTLLAMYALAAT